MSRSGYTDDCDDYWAHIRWRGAVASALRGKRGQAFLRELLTALDALEVPCLARNSLQTETGEVCALGSVGRARGLNMVDIDPNDYEAIAKLFGISEAMAREVMFVNDDWCATAAPSKRRFTEVRTWILEQINSVGQLVPVSTQGTRG